MDVGVIGCGYWGKNLARNFFELGRLQLICDATVTGRENANRVAPGIPVTESLDEILASPVQGVAIATPAETHFDIVMRALNAGKDVFVEKPMALTYEQGLILVNTATRLNRMLMVGHVLEYHPAVTALASLVREGALGKVHYVYSNRLSLGKIRREENILWSFAPHDIAVILRLMGTMPFQVSACGGSYLQPNIADVTLTNLLFDNGVRAHIHVSWLHPFKEQRLVVVGSRQMAVFDDVAKRLVLYNQRVEWQEGEPVPIRDEGQSIEYDKSEPLKLECMAFLDTMASREPALTEGRSGLQVLRVLQAAQRSLVLNGDPVRLPIDAENPIANGVLA